MRKFASIAIGLLLAVVELTTCGCRAHAPMFVWKNPQIPALRAQRIAMAPVSGTSEAKEKLELAMQLQKPAVAKNIAFLDPKTLESASQLQLASFDGQPSDVGSMSAARRAGSDVMLQAEVLRADLERTQEQILDRHMRPESIAVAVQLVDVRTGTQIASKTVAIDRVQAEKKYPDLEWMAGSGGDRVIAASAREAWEWMSPHLEREDVTLMKPWLSMGSSQVRRGNKFAQEGRWDLAEKEWQEAVDNHRWNKSGWYNLALASAAREDFGLARSRIRHAKSWYQPIPASYGAVWIERRQREYHKVFQLPDPEQGWSFPEPVILSPQEVPSTKPTDIEDMPWWTAIPFMKPPGWTWKSWLTQPWVP